MVNYENGKIYVIRPTVEYDEGDEYIGSTTKKYLSQRMDKHRSGYKQWKNGNSAKLTVYGLFDKYGIDNCEIILLETYQCTSKDELRAREGHYIKVNKCVNKRVERRTQKEYQSDNKEKIAKEKKKWYENNKEQIISQRKKYYTENKEQIKHKGSDYYEEKKEYILVRNKDYYEKNKEIILEKSRAKFICDCGSECRKSDRSRHYKSFKHQQHLNSIN